MQYERAAAIALRPAVADDRPHLLAVDASTREAAGKPLRIHVERFNPALRLYERLGFRQIEDKGVHLFMEWSSDNSQRSNPSTCSGLP